MLDFVARLQDTGPIKEDVPWAEIFSEVSETLSGLSWVGTLAEFLSPDPWEDSVTRSLGEILSKLDALILEVSGLRAYIDHTTQAQWRNELSTDLIAQVATVRNFVHVARVNGALNTNERDQFNLAIADLRTALFRICQFKDESDKAKIPLYVAVHAGAEMLSIAEKVSGVSTIILRSELAEFVRVFKLWKGVIEGRIAALRPIVEDAENYVVGYPRSGGVTWASATGEGLSVAGPDPEVGLLCVEIEGGIDSDFRIKRKWIEPRGRLQFEIYENPAGPQPPFFPLMTLHRVLTQNVDRGTVDILRGYYVWAEISYVEKLVEPMIAELNGRRASAIALIREILSLQSVLHSIEDSIVRFDEMGAAFP